VGGDAAVLRGVEDEFLAFVNPFKLESEGDKLQQQQRSHARRRWSHVFPQNEVEFNAESSSQQHLQNDRPGSTDKVAADGERMIGVTGGGKDLSGCSGAAGARSSSSSSSALGGSSGCGGGSNSAGSSLGSSSGFGLSGAFGLNMKSLSTPAVLPLTTDFLPSTSELESLRYTQRPDSVALGPVSFPPSSSSAVSSGSTAALGIHGGGGVGGLRGNNNGGGGSSSSSSATLSHLKLLREMVMQRLTADFQLVDAEGHQTTTMEPTQLQGGGLRYSLTMGHRIHRIEFLPPFTHIKVTEYSANSASKEEIGGEAHNEERYRYLLWVPLVGGFQVMEQRFERFPDPLSWNTIDQLIVTPLAQVVGLML
jgi:hypothetical protein